MGMECGAAERSKCDAMEWCDANGVRSNWVEFLLHGGILFYACVCHITMCLNVYDVWNMVWFGSNANNLS